MHALYLCAGKGMSQYLWAYPKDHPKKFTADLVIAVPHIKVCFYVMFSVLETTNGLQLTTITLRLDVIAGN